MKWTKEQESAITLPVSDLIVSAAAGSGKTAVMAERILSRITGENYVDIDKILVVTYTSAAAAEIKERIMKKIMEELAGGDNEVLQKQLIKLPYAHISTIHSFCLNLIKKYFYLLDIDPSAKIADETEIDILKSSAVNQVFDTHYQSKDAEFLKLISDYSNRRDSAICDTVVKLYDFSRTMPDSKAWIDSLDKMYSKKNSPVLEFLTKCAKLAGELALSMYRSAISLCKDNEDIVNIYNYLQTEIKKLEFTFDTDDYYEMYKRLSQLSFGRWPIYKGDCSVVPIIRSKRDEANKIINEKIKKRYIYLSEDEIREDSEKVLPYIAKYRQLASEFSDVFEKMKREKNLIDFSDFEHLALRLLRNSDNTPSQIADAVSMNFEEIYIDEYQDCNNIQNTIFSLISGARRNHPNVFCVGDIKQSIYSFRDSNPLLFREKCDNYPLFEGSVNPSNKILLNSNFRSRKSVLGFVNSLFTQIMSPECGDIVYDKDEYLYYGGGFDDVNEDTESIDITIIDESNGFGRGDKKDHSSALSNIEAEAVHVAERICRMVSSGYMLYDKKNKVKRSIEYKDFVVLLRSTSAAAPVFEKVFSSMGIPVYSDKGESYFDTEEINFLISFLKIVDNPDDDIALVSVLKNPIFSFDENVLMTIRLNSPDTSFYNCVKIYQKSFDDEISEKLTVFLNKLEDYYLKSRYMDTDEFLNYLIKDIGLYTYLSVFPDGKLKKSNVKLLLRKAREFEKTNFKGIYSFVRFVENTKQGKKVEGAKVLNENDNVVRIMSIHKSKGLEFPVVFVSCLGRKFNKQHLKDSVSMHKDLGMGIDRIYKSAGVKTNTVNNRSIKLKSDFESVSEELRVLYVALTRATEKLILTASCDNAPRILRKIENLAADEALNINPYLIYRCSSFLEMILYGVVRSDGYPSDFDYTSKITDGCKYNLSLINIEDISYSNSSNTGANWQNCFDSPSDEYAFVARKLDFVYQYADANTIPSNMTVTELKKRQIEEEEVYCPFDDVILSKPRIFASSQRLVGSDYGTLVHYIMENLSFKDISTADDVSSQIDRMHHSGLISDNELKAVDTNKIFSFFLSETGRRMKERSNFLKKEFSFKYLENADKIFDTKSNDEIVIQGTVDAFFEDSDGKLVIVDYKTDKVIDGNTELIAKRYHKQLDYYACALEKITGKTVKEKILYLFDVDRSLNV